MKGAAMWVVGGLLVAAPAHGGEIHVAGLYQCSRDGVKGLRSTPCQEGEITRSVPDPAQEGAGQSEVCRLYPHCANDAIPYREDLNVMMVPVLLGDRLVKEFMVDTGASLVTMDSETLSQLVRAKVIPASKGKGIMIIADGSKSEVLRVVLPSLQIGKQRFTNVEAFVSPSAGAMRLLGMNVLGQLQWRADRKEKLFFVR